MRHYLWQFDVSSAKPATRLEMAGPHASHPAVAPSKNRLAFTHNRGAQDYDIWRIQEGLAPAPFIASSMVDSNAEYSPDGRKIAFASDRAGETFDIWVANADGSDPIQLTHENGAAGSPRWSPDGRSIVFDLLTPEGEVDVYMVKVAGGHAQRLTWERTEDKLPAFSPDGKWIYFNSNRSGTNEFWRMPAAGGEAQQVTQEGADKGLVSADGETLYYTRPYALYAVPVTGGAEQLISRLVLNRSFSVTTEGIYYISTRQSDDRYELCILDPLTLQKRVLSRLEGPIIQGFSVSPDLKTILYTRQKDPQSDLKLIENFR
jgi:Tol biopolymer transport system component